MSCPGNFCENPLTFMPRRGVDRGADACERGSGDHHEVSIGLAKPFDASTSERSDVKDQDAKQYGRHDANEASHHTYVREQVHAVSAPEINSGSAVAALTLLLGAVALMRSRGRS